MTAKAYPSVVVRGDARRLPLRSRSVDLVVTSPPYYGQRSYKDGGKHYAGQIGDESTPAQFLDRLLDVTRECFRVLKASGSMFVNLGDKYGSDKALMLLPERYRIACQDTLGLTVRATMVWSKPSGMPEAVTDRVRRTHEDWVHLTAGPDYFADLDAARQPYEGVPQRRMKARIKDRRDEGRPITGWDLHWEQPKSGEHPLGKVPSSVWSVAPAQVRVPPELGVTHFAAFPTEWPRRLIAGWCPPGGVVLDPFSGTGTTAMCARALGRTAVGVDLSADYCRVGQWRINDQKQIDRVRADMPVLPEPDLFGETA